jgi:hypothetical protein
MARDPKAVALAKVVTTRATFEKVTAATETASYNLRHAMLKAFNAGVSKAEISRAATTSWPWVHSQIIRARSEKE